MTEDDEQVSLGDLLRDSGGFEERAEVIIVDEKPKRKPKPAKWKFYARLTLGVLICVSILMFFMPPERKPSEPTATPTRRYVAPVLPASRYAKYALDFSEPLMLTNSIDNIPAGKRVIILRVSYENDNWVYSFTASGYTGIYHALEEDLMLFKLTPMSRPMPTPTTAN